MARAAVKKSNKRTASVRDGEEEAVQEKQPVIESAFAQDVGLEMQSDDEGEQEDVPEEDDNEVEAFPEIDTRSDTEDEDADTEEDEDEEDEEDEDEPDESEDEYSDDSDDSIHPFPVAKTIVSDITGQPKRVYPPIEPDYDSDSSTEDVRLLSMYSEVCTLNMTMP